MDPLDALKGRLNQLEQTLSRLVNGMEEDIAVARELQRALMPNHTPAVPGLRSLARYISAQQIHSESFDLIPTKDNRELWVVTAWTQTFGLSSILLQALVHLQSRAIVESRPKITPAETFNEISTALTGARKSGAYRLMVTKLNLANLELSGVAVGQMPWLRRTRQGSSGFGAWDFVQPEPLRLRPELIRPASSESPTMAAQAYSFQAQLSPGTRLFYLSPGWNEQAALNDYLAPLALESAPQEDLPGDLNHLLMGAQAQLKRAEREADITGLAFEIDAKKLHLA